MAQRIAEQAPTAPLVGWEDFREFFRRTYNQDMHVTLLGPTDCGKSTMAQEVVYPNRDRAVIFGTKPRDSTLEKLLRKGFKRIYDWPPRTVQRKVILWPTLDNPIKDIPKQQEVFARALLDIYRSGSWCVGLDEVKYITKRLKLAPLVELLLEQGRSLDVSVVCATQRPAWIPLAAYDQPFHLFLWNDGDLRNATRLSEIAGNRMVRDILINLPEHQALYVNTRSRKMLRTQVAA